MPDPQQQESNRDEFGRFVIGKSGNPGGRPKGAFSIKDRIRQILTDEPHVAEKLVRYYVNDEKMRGLVWQMMEGRPSQQVDLGVDKEGIAELTKFFRAVTTKNDGTGNQPTSLPDSPTPI